MSACVVVSMLDAHNNTPFLQVTVHEVTDIVGMADKNLFIVFEVSTDRGLEDVAVIQCACVCVCVLQLQDVSTGTALATQHVPVDTSSMAR